MKNVFKIIGCSVLAVLIALSCVIIPKKISKNQKFLGTSLNSASASVLNVTPTSSFYGNNTIFAPSSYINYNNLDNLYDFTPYLNTSSTKKDFIYDYIPLSFSILNYNQRYESYFDNRIYMGVDFLYNEFVNVSYNEFMYDYDDFVYQWVNINDLNRSPDISDIGSYTLVKDSTLPFFITVTNRPDLGTFYINFGLTIHKSFTEDNYQRSSLAPSSMTTLYYSNNEDFINLFGFDSPFTNCNIICYKDSNDYVYSFYIPFFSNGYNQGKYLNRTYYLIPNGVNFTDNDYYQQGVSDGYTNGYNAGEQSGYTDGYNAGEDVGFNAGYVEGLNTADGFTFYNLIGAVFDAPLNTFTSLFNFEILGINLLNFFSSILTLAIVIWLIKIALGGK